MKTKTKELLAAQSYTFSIQRDEDGDFVGRVEELPGCLAHGRTPADALRRLEAVQRLWIEDAVSRGEPVPPPQREEQRSGRWVQRVPRSLHSRLVAKARLEGVSLNHLGTAALAAYEGATAPAPEWASTLTKEVRALSAQIRSAIAPLALNRALRESPSTQGQPLVPIGGASRGRPLEN
jgi:antitoxin HicB